jgi:hypothetical protein
MLATESSCRECGDVDGSAGEFFIVGCPRSGTTLLRWMLDSHSEIAVTPETHFGANYVRNRDRFGVEGEPSARSALLDDFCRSAGFREMAIDESRFRARAQSDPTDPWLPLRVAMQDFGRRRKSVIVGEKTPSHAVHIEALSEAFPDARFLILRRDPRAVVASWHRTTWSKRTSTEVSEKWRRYSQAMRRACRSLPHRCLEIRYEELVSDPTAELKTICAFLGTTFDPGMLFYHERDASSPDEGVDFELTFEPPNPSRIDAWRAETPARELRRIEAICGHEMVVYGYGRDTSVGERLGMSITVLPMLWRKRVRRRLKERRRGNLYRGI